VGKGLGGGGWERSGGRNGIDGACYLVLVLMFLPVFQGQEDKGISPEGKHPTLEDLGLFANCTHCHHMSSQ